jgi:hypothetical protein
MARAHHLPEDRLFDCYVAACAGDPLDPPAAEHLADCSECAARYAELDSFMDGLRAEAEAETDEMFTPDRLQAQQAAIAERLGHIGRAARVISFPGRLVSRHMTATGSRVAPRWLAAAAAAGLFVGVGAGQLFYRPGPTGASIDGFSSRARIQIPVQQPEPAAAAQAPPLQVIPVIDEAFLAELELALERPRTRELLAFDEMTPTARPITAQVR